MKKYGNVKVKWVGWNVNILTNSYNKGVSDAHDWLKQSIKGVDNIAVISVVNQKVEDMRYDLTPYCDDYWNTADQVFYDKILINIDLIPYEFSNLVDDDFRELL